MLHMPIYRIKNKLIKSELHKEDIKLTIYLNYSYSCMLGAFTTHGSFLDKNTASYGIMCVTLNELPFANGNCDKQSLISCVPHTMPSKDLIEFTLYMCPVSLSNKITEL